MRGWWERARVSGGSSNFAHSGSAEPALVVRRRPGLSLRLESEILVKVAKGENSTEDGCDIGLPGDVTNDLGSSGPTSPNFGQGPVEVTHTSAQRR